MTDETLQKANEVKHEIDIVTESVNFFSPMNDRYVSRWNEESVERAKQKKFQFSLCGRHENGKNKVQLNFRGFFGGSTIEVDNDFIIMCQEYFKKKLEEKKKELESLN